MNDWNLREYLRQRSAFIAERSHRHPMVTSTALIFGVTWLAGCGLSFLLLTSGIESMPLRYAIAFALSYPVFFLCVRAWCDSVSHDRGAGGGGFDFGGASDGEGCLIVLGIFLAAVVVVFLFWLAGGFPLLLEVAFEVAFAGTVVRRLSQTEIVGRWAYRLLMNTWLHALVALLALVATAAALQRAAPNEHTFAAALRTVMHHR